MLVCAAPPCGNVLATRVIHYYDNLLHACLRSVTLRKRFDNRLIHYCENILHACSCSVTLRKSIASPIQTAIAITSCMLGVQRHLVETFCEYTGGSIDVL